MITKDREVLVLARRLMRADGLLPNHELFGASFDLFHSALSNMSPEARRKVVRAFRKAWRLVLKKEGFGLGRAYRLSQKDKRNLVRDSYCRKAERMLRKAVWSQTLLGKAMNRTNEEIFLNTKR